MLWQIQGDARQIPLRDESVQCVVTSPPYYGLRNYQIHGQIGLEKTYLDYVETIVQVFREVRRVLKPDGVVFLNLGDSYFGGGRGGGGSYGHERRGWRAIPYGISGKAPASYQNNDCLCGNLCDVCRVVYRTHKSRSDGLLVAMLTASLSVSSRACMGSLIDHLPTSDLVDQANHSADATQGHSPVQGHANEQIRASLVSMLGELPPQLLDECLRRDNLGVCLLCAHSLPDLVPAFADTLAEPTVQQPHISGNGSHDDRQVHRNQGKDTVCECCGGNDSGLAYQDYTTVSLKPKDLMGIPWRVAFALQADGWYLRSDIIWAKPNPMPESVMDRPTRSHEYLFLLSKSARYHYDAAAIRTPAKSETRKMPDGWDTGLGGHGAFHRDGREKGKTTDKQRGHSRRHNGFNGRWDAMEKAEQQQNGANARSVWWIATQGTPLAHFATFPEALVRPCILAGSRPGDIVLDPFAGTGTVGKVALEHGRKAVMIDLNHDYLRLDQRKRYPQIGMGI